MGLQFVVGQQVDDDRLHGHLAVLHSNAVPTGIGVSSQDPFQLINKLMIT